MKLSSKVENN